MHISLAAETLISIGSFPITNSLLCALLLSVALIFVAWRVKKANHNLNSRFYNSIEAIVELLDNFTASVLGKTKLARRVLPLAGTIFIYVVLSNWIGVMPLIGSVGFEMPAEEGAIAEEHVSENYQPGFINEAYAATETHESEVVHEEAAVKGEGESEHHSVFVPLFRPAHADLNMTLALAIISVFMTQVFGLQMLGMGYVKKFFNFKNPIETFVGLLEIISETVKIFSFSFRLFGNIFAGEVLLVVISTLMPFIGPLPFLGIEMFAGAIQGLIFSMLTLVFIAGAVTSHDHGDEHDEKEHTTQTAESYDLTEKAVA